MLISCNSKNFTLYLIYLKRNFNFLKLKIKMFNVFYNFLKKYSYFVHFNLGILGILGILDMKTFSEINNQFIEFSGPAFYF